MNRTPEEWAQFPCYEDDDDVVGYLDLAIADIAEQAARIKKLEDAIKEVLSWRDLAEDLTCPIEIRAAWMRARALLQDKEGE